LGFQREISLKSSGVSRDDAQVMNILI